MPAIAGSRHRRPSQEKDAAAAGADARVGGWLARCAAISESELDFDALAEASELGLNTGIGRSVLADLRRNPPPKFTEAQAACIAAEQAANSPANPASARKGRRSPNLSPSPLQAAAALALPRSRSVEVAGPCLPMRQPLARPPLPGGPGSGGGNASSSNAPSPRPGGIASPGEDPLTGAMASRLLKAEQLCKQLADQLAEQTRENLELRKEVEALRCCNSGRGEGKGSLAEAVLRQERDELQQQLNDMKKLLHDYGLRPPASNSDRKRQPEDGAGMEVDIHVLQARVESLNAAYEDNAIARRAAQPSQLEGNVARLRIDDNCLPITFFCDGLKLADHAFLMYAYRPAQDAIKDILDGSFPRALQEEFPDGAILKVIDRTAFTFKAWLRDSAASDKDLTDGGDHLRPNAGQAAQKDMRSAGDRFLAKLPERVIKGGQVCNIRGAIARQLTPSTSAVSDSSSAAGPNGASSRWKSKEVSLLDANRDASAPSAKLQVKLEGGQRVQLQMEPHATIGDVWKALAQWRAANCIPKMGAEGKTYSLRSAFPARLYDDSSVTLQDAGLMPSATLFVGCEQN